MKESLPSSGDKEALGLWEVGRFHSRHDNGSFLETGDNVPVEVRGQTTREPPPLLGLLAVWPGQQGSASLAQRPAKEAQGNSLGFKLGEESVLRRQSGSFCVSMISVSC